jgi:hypothetical protein
MSNEIVVTASSRSSTGRPHRCCIEAKALAAYDHQDLPFEQVGGAAQPAAIGWQA